MRHLHTTVDLAARARWESDTDIYPPLHDAVLAVPLLCVVVTEQLPVFGNGLPPSFGPGPLLGVLA